MCSRCLHPTPLPAHSREDSFALTCPVLTQGELLPHMGTPTVDKEITDDISFLYLEHIYRLLPEQDWFPSLVKVPSRSSLFRL
ncbi:hypothetical protein SRHO_G00332210 [Serrasalmus rhombeus]